MRQAAAPDRRIGALGLTAIVFFCGTLIAFWAAFDPSAAATRLFAITLGIAGAALLVLLGRRPGSRLAGWAGLACLILAGLISAYFLWTNDWAATASSKLAHMQRVGVWVQQQRPDMPFGFSEDLNGNVAASALIILLPLGIGGGLSLLREGLDGVVAWLIFALIVGLGLLSSVAIALSLSRGAWVGLAVALLAALYVSWRRRNASRLRWLDRGLFLAFVVALAGGLAITLALPAGSSAVQRLDALLGVASTSGGAGTGRVTLWHDMLTLVRDYPLTGSGLGATMMVFSSYVLMLHVGFITHAHNLLLQIAVEQGLPTMLALAAAVGLCLWLLLRDGILPDSSRPFPVAAALAAIVALAVHGMVDAGLYVSRLAPVVFVPFGFAALAWGRSTSSSRPDGRASWPNWLVLIGISGLLIVFLLPPFRSALQSNLGAVFQTRAELSVYQWPEWPLQDAVRRSGEVDLRPALTSYNVALALNPRNATANRRLGQIELSLGEYDSATSHIQSAFAAAPGDRASRQLAGEVYAIGGALEQAARLWRTINLSQKQPDLRSWWYTNIGEPVRAERVSQAARMAGW